MNPIERGFSLKDPHLELGWGTTAAAAVQVLRGSSVKSVTPSRLELSCSWLGMDDAVLHLCFTPRGNHFYRVEFLRHPTRKKRKLFDELQGRLEAWLGPGAPKPNRHSVDGITPVRWRFGKVLIEHDYYYQNGQYEKITIEHQTRG